MLAEFDAEVYTPEKEKSNTPGHCRFICLYSGLTKNGVFHNDFYGAWILENH